MITSSAYKVMGADGKEYGPISAEQVRQWVAQGRLVKKTPTLPVGTKDWVYLESVPEFADLFPLPPLPTEPLPSKFWFALAGVVFAVILLVWELISLLPKKPGHH